MNFSQILKAKLFQHTVIYTGINIFDKTIPFLIIPILTRLISKEEIGLYTLYQTLFQILIPILTLSIDNTIIINYYKQNKKDFSDYFSTGLVLSLFVYLVFVIFGITFSSTISSFFGLPPFWIQVTMVNVLLQFFTQLRKNLWRIKKQPLKYGYFSIPLTFSKNIIGLIFVYYYFGWEGIIIGHLISQLFFSIIAIYSFIKSKLLSFKYFKKYTKDMLTVGVPISIHKIGTWLSTALNRVYINNFIGATATGVFGISATFGTIITVIGDAINQAYAPYLYERLKTFNKNTQIQLVKLISYYYLFYFLVAFLIFLTGYYGVQIIFGDSYIEARKYVFPLVLTATINALYKIHVNFIFFTKKTFIISRITILCGALNIGLAYFSIKFYGMLGAAYSGLIIQVLIYLLILFFSYKEYKLPWSNIFNINK